MIWKFGLISWKNDLSNLANSHQNTWKFQNWYFYGILLFKVENAWAKHLQRSYVLSLKNLKNLHFNRLPLKKVFNFWAKTVQRSYVWWYLILIQDLKEKWLLVWKIIWRIWQIFTREIESLNIGILMGFFSPKLKMYEFKIYMGVMCHDNEKWCQN